MPNSEKKPVDENLDLPATKGALKSLEQRFETRFEQIDARFERMDKRFGQVDDRFDELKRHFDVVAEAFKTQFNNLFDRTQSKTSTIGARLDALELTCTAGAPTKPRRSLLRKRTQEG